MAWYAELTSTTRRLAPHSRPPHGRTARRHRLQRCRPDSPAGRAGLLALSRALGQGVMSAALRLWLPLTYRTSELHRLLAVVEEPNLPPPACWSGRAFTTRAQRESASARGWLHLPAPLRHLAQRPALQPVTRKKPRTAGFSGYLMAQTPSSGAERRRLRRHNEKQPYPRLSTTA